MAGCDPAPGYRGVLLEEPFRLFFPLGALSAAAGVAPWILQRAGLGQSASGYGHGLVQIQGFEMAFATGFLMTALPRFLESRGTRMWELALGLALCAAATVALVLQRWTAGEALFLALGAHLTLFALRRLRRRGDDPPPFFAFLPIGLACAVAGAALILWPLDRLPRLGELLVEQGILLSFVLAVGSHLGPRLLYGERDSPETTTSAAHRRLRRLFAVGLLLLATFPLEAAGFPRAGLALRAAVVTAYLLFALRVHRPPTQPLLLHVHLLRLSFWSLAGGLWLAAFQPDYAMASLHLTFAGGFGLMTFVIATRVVAGHCGFEDLWQHNRAATAVPLALVALSVPVRLAAVAAPALYFDLVAAAAALWLLGALAWGVVFVPKMAPWHVAP